ncbi:MAG: DUF3426 domain-containing protein [Desulfuromonadaceae bacterium]|nr:DUF3426 domain-containing protein [Desulfuromonadaceae bacterium]MDD5104112.1 DUF3426 domain-containing protein [Desulfuromonadaceae bacterium]
MIIRCDKCQTRFRLEDSRVPDKGVKVRCTKCKNVFRVYKESPVTKSGEEAPVVLSPFAFEETPTAVQEREEIATDAEMPETSETAPFDAASFDSSVFSHTEDEEESPFTASVPETESISAGESDLPGFDFDTATTDVDTFLPFDATDDAFSGDVDTKPLPQQDTVQHIDFSDDGLFGTVVNSAPEPSLDRLSFAPESGEEQLNSTEPTASRDTHGVESFDPGDIDFGDEAGADALQDKCTGEQASNFEFHISSPASDTGTWQSGTATADDTSTDQQELPPLTITSRRKSSTLFTALIALATVIVLAVLGYLGFSTLSTPKDVPQESGKITVRSIKAAFVTNESAGELLVVSGEVLNEYSKPRASLQVKVTVFDESGKGVITKSAYGGNPLTKEQLISLPLDKIEAAMANQFGDSLVNMEVAPGQAIPFVVVLATLPNGAKNYEVQPGGSTVATGKQQ